MSPSKAPVPEHAEFAPLAAIGSVTVRRVRKSLAATVRSISTIGCAAVFALCGYVASGLRTENWLEGECFVARSRTGVSTQNAHPERAAL